MVKIIGVIAIVLIGAVAVVLALAATKPDVFRIERATSIRAPPERAFLLIADLHAWRAWSPWEDKDPALKRTYAGAASGPGAIYAWEGNGNVGQGRMEIKEATPPSKVAIGLDFVKPFQTHNDVEFTLAPEGDSTRVTWAMHGPTPYVAKILHVFLDMDRLVGRDFEAGLAKLKAVAEGEAAR